jgi:uncharacterized membrane protein YozB (DUF420 family)
MRTLEQVGYVLLLLLAVPLAINALSYGNFNPEYGFLRLKAKAIETGLYLPAYYAHVLVAGLILPLGVIQVHPVWGQKWRRLHRLMGKFYVAGVLLLAAPGGLLMSIFIGRGPWVLSSFILQSACWFAFTLIAFLHIRSGNIDNHRRWMIRSFSVAMAAITLRLYVFISSWSIDLSQPVAYGTIAWLSWVPNLLLVELYLAKKPTAIATSSAAHKET